jgi:transposase-like protein
VRVSTDQRTTTECKGSHFERDVILWAVRWYLAYPISDRQLEEMMNEHGVEVDLATLNRWVLKYVPLLEQEFRARKQPVGPSWRMDETCVRVKGAWKQAQAQQSWHPPPDWLSAGFGANSGCGRA